MKYRRMLELVRALRSGKYIQAEGALRDDGDDKHKYSYCCLGVACVLAGKSFDSIGQITHKGEKESNIMSADVMDYFGFTSTTGMPSDGEPLLVGGVKYAKLTTANDMGRTFKEIADAIRANWRRL